MQFRKEKNKQLSDISKKKKKTRSNHKVRVKIVTSAYYWYYYWEFIEFEIYRVLLIMFLYGNAFEMNE